LTGSVTSARNSEVVRFWRCLRSTATSESVTPPCADWLQTVNSPLFEIIGFSSIFPREGTVGSLCSHPHSHCRNVCFKPFTGACPSASLCSKLCYCMHISIGITHSPPSTRGVAAWPQLTCLCSVHVSSQVHAGIYYPQGSNKAEFCVRGRDMLFVGNAILGGAL
jgi:hypothetical protein